MLKMSCVTRALSTGTTFRRRENALIKKKKTLTAKVIVHPPCGGTAWRLKDKSSMFDGAYHWLDNFETHIVGTLNGPTPCEYPFPSSIILKLSFNVCIVFNRC